MGTLPLPQNLFFGLFVVLLAINFASAGSQAETTVVVVGATECLDCSAKNIKTSSLSNGVYVVIECKGNTGKYEAKGVGIIDNVGKFSVKLPSDLLRNDGKMKQECVVELRGASNIPCPEKLSKLVLKSKEKGKHTFAAVEKLLFSSTCTSAFLWPPYNFPPMPKLDPFHKKFPWHKPFLKKPLLPPIPVPIYTTPVSPSAPEYKPPVSPFYKPPVSPVYKPPVPAYKPPASPVYKPPVPAYKPPVPVYNPTPMPQTVPVYKPPVPTPAVPYYKPPLIPPIFKKPHPPFPKLPLIYHPHPKFNFPPIYKKPLPPIFYHPKFPPYSHHPWKKKYLKPKHPIFPPTKEEPKP